VPVGAHQSVGPVLRIRQCRFDRFFAQQRIVHFFACDGNDVGNLWHRGRRGHICRTPKRAISSTIEIKGEIFFTSGSMLTLKRGLTRLPFSI